MKPAVKVAVTGAGGQIGYSLLFRIASGEMLGRDQPIILQLLEIPEALPALEGVCMELVDCAFPLLHGISYHSDPQAAFKGVHYALLVGARPRGPGMERKDLLEANAQIFSVQGQALSECANPDVRVLVVGNPANTNALITAANAPKLAPRQITAMTRLDHNRALGLLSQKLGCSLGAIEKVAVWGNHSATQFSSLEHATLGTKRVLDIVDNKWYREEFIQQVAGRGAAIIKARGKSSAASAAEAAISHIRSWVLGSSGKWTSMGIVSDGSYGIAKGIYYSFPVICEAGNYAIVKDLEISSFAQEKMAVTQNELLEERKAIEALLPKEGLEAVLHGVASDLSGYNLLRMQETIYSRQDGIVTN